MVNEILVLIHKFGNWSFSVQKSNNLASLLLNSEAGFTCSMPAYKVYISSTYKDLKLHRQAVLGVFLKNADRFEVHAMEGYVAESRTPLDKCLADVAACNLYILILSNRYGYIPNDPVRNPEGLSITHLEYRTAYARSQQNQCKLLCFVSNGDESIFPYDADDEDGQKQRKLAQFRREATTDFLCGSPFRYDYELRADMQDALIRELALQLQPVGTQLHEIVKHCCDRRPQLADFRMQDVEERPFSVYEIRSRPDDLGDNFIKRLGWEFMDWQRFKVTPSLTSSTLFYSTDYERFKQYFFINLYTELFKTEPMGLVPLNAILQKWAHPYLIVNFMLNDDVVDDSNWKLLMRLCLDFEQTLHGHTGLKVYFFINLDCAEPESNTRGPRPAAYYILNLDRPFSFADLKKWFYSFVREDEDLFDSVSQAFLVQSQATKPLTMRVAERELGKLISQCNRTEKFLDYLQTL